MAAWWAERSSLQSSGVSSTTIPHSDAQKTCTIKWFCPFSSLQFTFSTRTLPEEYLTGSQRILGSWMSSYRRPRCFPYSTYCRRWPLFASLAPLTTGRLLVSFPWLQVSLQLTGKHGQQNKLIIMTEILILKNEGRTDVKCLV